jgi:hypothetical protein
MVRRIDVICVAASLIGACLQLLPHCVGVCVVCGVCVCVCVCVGVSVCVCGCVCVCEVQHMVTQSPLVTEVAACIGAAEHQPLPPRKWTSLPKQLTIVLKPFWIVTGPK